MKSRQVEELLKSKGFERGAQHILEALVEDMNVIKKHQAEMAAMLDKMIVSLSNVVQGAGAMRQEMMSKLKHAGLLEKEDDLPVSTQSIGDGD